MTDLRARPTMYKGIRMRSRLEAGYAAWLDQWGFTWEYEPQAFASSDGQYLPDFLLRNVPHASGAGHVGTSDVYVEVKSANWTGDRDALARRMAIVTESVGWGTAVDLLLEVPGQQPQGLFVLPTASGGRTVSWHAMAWTYDVADRNDPLGRPYGVEFLAIAPILNRDLMPWPHGYWNGPG